MKDLNVTLVQCHQVWENKEANLKHYSDLLEKAMPNTDLIVFPEMFHTGFSMNVNSLAEEMEGNAMRWLSGIAKRYKAAVCTSLIIQENRQFYNRLVFMQEDGSFVFYDKRKLFGLAKEDQIFSAGASTVIVSYKSWNILLQVCYDLRFPSIQRNKVVDGDYDYDLLLNVANWPEKRSLHWKTLLRARAIENQAYVVGVNRVGEGNNLTYSGDSAAITPLGETLLEITQEERISTLTLSSKYLAEIREKLPFLKDRE